GGGAATEVPGEATHFSALQAWIFIRRGEDLIQTGQWEPALARTEPGLTKLDDKPRQELHAWRTGVFVRWAQGELRQGRFDEALAVLERGMAAAPKETRLAGFLGHVAQEWARATYRAEGPDQAKRLFTQLQARYPDRAAIRDGARGYFHVIVKSLCDEQKYEEALGFIDRHAD